MLERPQITSSQLNKMLADLWVNNRFVVVVLHSHSFKLWEGELWGGVGFCGGEHG